MAGQDLQLLSSGQLAHLRLERIGFVFQTYNLLPVLTALENAEFTLLLQGMPARKRREKVEKLFIALSDAKKKAGENVSGSLESFSSFVQKKTDQLRKQYGCQAVEYSVDVADGKVKLTAKAKV